MPAHRGEHVERGVGALAEQLQQVLAIEHEQRRSARARSRSRCASRRRAATARRRSRPARAVCSRIFWPAVSLTNSSTAPSLDDEHRVAGIADAEQRSPARDAALVHRLREHAALVVVELREQLDLRQEGGESAGISITMRAAVTPCRTHHAGKMPREAPLRTRRSRAGCGRCPSPTGSRLPRPCPAPRPAPGSRPRRRSASWRRSGRSPRAAARTPRSSSSSSCARRAAARRRERRADRHRSRRRSRTSSRRGAARRVAAARSRGARRRPARAAARGRRGVLHLADRRATRPRCSLHFRPGQRRQWMRLLEPDDVADVIQEAGRGRPRRRCSRCSTRRRARRSPRCSPTPRTRPAA